MAIDLNRFLHSLAIFMAAGAGGLAYASGSPKSLWIHQAVELGGASADPYSVLAIFGPGRQNNNWDPLPRASVQCRTTAIKSVDAMARGQLLLETLRESDGSPLRMKQIAGFALDGTADGHWKIVSADPPASPSMMGPDDRNRANVVFNFDVGFFKDAS